MSRASASSGGVGKFAHRHVTLDPSTGDASPVPPRLAQSTALLAVIMPLHPPKLPWAQRFLQSISLCNVQRLGWFPVFSTASDLALAANHSVLTSAIVDTALAIVAKPARVNPVTSKKWLALRYVFASSRIPFAMALDAETVFSRRAPADLLLRWLRTAHGGTGVSTPVRLVYGTAEFAKDKWWPPLNGGGRPILRATHESCDMLRASAAERARLNASRVRDHFWWFGDAPLYEHGAFLAFWERLHWRPSVGGSLSWYAFDHVAYECYLLLSGHSRLVSVDSMLSEASLVRSSGTGDLCCGMEIASLAEQRSLTQAYGHGFLWVHATMRARAAVEGDRLPATPRLLTYHIDRCLDGGACRPKQRDRLRDLLGRCGDEDTATDNQT